jgi:drug/metabolite transporter (DMT)-like permease
MIARTATRFHALPAPLRAAIWMALGGVFFSSMSVFIRLLSAELHAFQIAFFRNAFAVLWMLPWLISHWHAAVGGKRHRLYLSRSLLGLVGMLGSFYGVIVLPLADATALSFTGPLFATIGAALILKEDVRLRRWGATIMGFVGVLIVVRPGADSFSWVAVVVLVSAATSAGTTLLVKTLSRTEPPEAIVVNMVLYLTPLSLVPALWVWVTPSWYGLFIAAMLAGVGTLGHMCMTRGFAAADASAVMPYDYLRLLFAAAFGFAVFSEVPEVWTWLGGAVIALSSIYIARREAVVAREGERSVLRAASKTVVGDGSPPGRPADKS